MSDAPDDQLTFVVPAQPMLLGPDIDVPPEQVLPQLARARYLTSKRLPYIAEPMFATPATPDPSLKGFIRFGSRVMRWSPPLFALADEELASFEVAHEMGHWLFDTAGRARKHVSITPQGGTVACNRDKFWFAACVAINDWLSSSFPDAPWAKHAQPHPSHFGLPSGKTTEFYYEHLPDPPEQPACAQSRLAGDDESLKSEAMRCQCAGQLPGDQHHDEVLSFVERHRVKFDWTRQLFRDMHGRGMASRTETSSFTRMSKLQHVMPKNVRLMGRRPLPAATIAVILDTSGSITDDIRERFASVVRQLVDLTSFYLITNDAAVAETGDVYSWRDVLPMVRGGGGTDFTPAFDHLNALKRPFAGVYILTDGYAYVPLSKPLSCPITWCIYGDAPPPANWGTVLRIPTT